LLRSCSPSRYTGAPQCQLYCLPCSVWWQCTNPAVYCQGSITRTAALQADSEVMIVGSNGQFMVFTVSSLITHVHHQQCMTPPSCRIRLNPCAHQMDQAATVPDHRCRSSASRVWHALLPHVHPSVHLPLRLTTAGVRHCGHRVWAGGNLHDPIAYHAMDVPDVHLRQRCRHQLLQPAGGSKLADLGLGQFYPHHHGMEASPVVYSVNVWEPDCWPTHHASEGCGCCGCGGMWQAPTVYDVGPGLYTQVIGGGWMVGDRNNASATTLQVCCFYLRACHVCTCMWMGGSSLLGSRR
jgi:hypothetical protein